MHKLYVFQTKCLRRICNILLPNNISNEDLYRKTYSLPIIKLSDPEIQNGMVGLCLENVTRSHTKGSTEMDTHRKNDQMVVPTIHEDDIL